MATTLYRSATCIYAMLAALEDAQNASNAPLDDVVAQVEILKIKLETNPQTLTEGELIQTATMLWGFLSQSFTNIRRFFRDMDSGSSVPVDVALADGTHLADGSISAV